MSMKAVLCKTLGGPLALTLEDVPIPRPEAGQVIVRVGAVALNFFDTLITRGKYQHKPELPFSPGGEIAGTVEEIGAGVMGLKAGDRVMAYIGWGGARERVAVDASAAVPIPPGVSVEMASAVSITYGTATHGLIDRGGLKEGETVAVLGAAGGAGQAAVQIAKLMGARVIGVAAGGDKLEICKAAGADEVIDYANGNIKSGLKEMTGGRGVDVVYDCVGGPHAEAALRATAWDGRFLVVGFASGDIPSIPINLLLVKGCAMIGVFWGEAVKRDPVAHHANMVRVLDWVASGRLQPRIDKTFPLERAVDALKIIDDRMARGKIVLTV